MKDNLRRFKAFIKLFGKELDMFYVMSPARFDIKAQADFNSDLVVKILKRKFKQIPLSAETNGYLNFTRGNITITLT